MASFLLGDNQKVTLSVTFTDEVGNAGAVDGIPTWDVSDEALLSVESSADGLSAVVTAVGPLGAGQVSVSADADIGAGVTDVIGTLDVEVVASQAIAANMSTGTPEHK